MEFISFLAVVHVLACVILVGLVLIQDSKGGGVFNSQSGSNSFLGATGATTLAGNTTKIIAGLLAITCILIARESANLKKSVVDSTMMNSGAVTSEPAAAPAAAAPATTETAAPGAIPAQPEPAKK